MHLEVAFKWKYVTYLIMVICILINLILCSNSLLSGILLQLATGDGEPFFNLLNLFAYGTYSDYISKCYSVVWITTAGTALQQVPIVYRCPSLKGHSLKRTPL